MNIFLVLLFSLNLFSGGITSGKIAIESDLQGQNSNGIMLIINNIRNKVGIIRIGVFSTSKGYPGNPSFSFSLSKDSVVSGQIKLLITIKEPGTYGISVLDDENENGKMDYRLGIIPKESFGFSNNPKTRKRREPDFEETCFKYDGGRKEILVGMVYM